MSYRLLVLIILSILHSNDILGRSEPILILNRATQCYFNSGLQCIFATKTFAPWIEKLSPECFIASGQKEKKIVEALQQLTTNYNAISTKWADNEGLFKAIQAQANLESNEQGDVNEMMTTIFSALPTNCKNPFIMKFTTDYDNINNTTKTVTQKKEITSSSLWIMESSTTAKTNLIDAYATWFFYSENLKENDLTRVTRRIITQFPSILCCTINFITTENETIENFSIPSDIFIGRSIISESFVLEKGEQVHYKLVGIAWRTAPDLYSPTGHYFATVQYRTTWHQPGTWYILDEATNYESLAAPNEDYDILSLPPKDALKIESLFENEKRQKADTPIYRWANRIVTLEKLTEWLTQGSITVDEDSTALPTFIVYEREMTEQEKKESGPFPKQALSESLQQLQQDLTSLSTHIK